MHELRSTRCAALVIPAILGLVFAGCSAQESALAAVVSAPPQSTRPGVFSGEGLPGPWWQRGASRDDFDRDQRSCRARSTEARDRAVEDRSDAAYRAFLDCMVELAWTRGAPPRRPLPAAMEP